MASNINSTDIDQDFPVAGQDNDSQGFRDNFDVIKTSLATAKTEITALQDNTAKLNENNDFNGNNIQEANLIACTETRYTVGSTLSANVDIDFRNGHYQIHQVGADIELTLTGWPESGKLGKMRLAITGDGTARTITWVASGGTLKVNSGFNVTDSGGDTISGVGGWPSTFQVSSSTAPVFVDLWTTDAGVTVYGHYHGAYESQ